MAVRFTRTDDAFPSHPGEPYTYPQARVPERDITEEGVRQYMGPTWKLLVSETASTGTVTLILIDVAHTVDPANPVTFEQDGTSHPPTTGPASGVTSGTYTYTFTKDLKHNILIAPVIHQLNGLADIRPGTETFDIDNVANVETITYTVVGQTANFKVQFDTDTGTGATNGQYSLDAGTTWTSFAVDSAKTGTFSVAMTANEQPLLVRGKDAGGVAGPAVSSTVPGNGISLTVFMQISDTQAEITWAGINVTLSIDGGAYATPPADEDAMEGGNQIIVTRDGTHHTYAFKSLVGGQASSAICVVPALGVISGGSFSGLTNTLNDETTNTIMFQWTWSGSPVPFNVYVNDNDRVYVIAGTTSTGATSYIYTSPADITTNRSDPTRVIGFFVEAILGETLGPRSIACETTYNYAA